MKKYAFTFSGSAEYDHKVKSHSFLLRCVPGTFPFQRTYAHKLTISPYCALTSTTDFYGNGMHTGTIDKAHGKFSFTSTGFVLCSKYIIHEPLDRLFLYPSKLTQPTPTMGLLLAQAPLPQDPWQRAVALGSRLSRHMTYDPTVADANASDAFVSGRANAVGYVHAFLALCRLVSIGARFVWGLAVGHDTPHCWAEVYCDGLWRAYDPITASPIEEGFLKISHGQDTEACAVERYFFRSEPELKPVSQTYHVEVTEHVIRTRDTVPHA